MFGSKDLLFTSEKYGVAKSLRFRSGSSTYLNRTQGVATNGFIWTWSAWVKRGSLGSNQVLFCAGAPTNTEGVQFIATDVIQIFRYTGTYTIQLDTTQVFRDPSAWYHLVVANDVTQATASNRIKFYVNGSQVTSFTTATYPPQNTQYEINNNGQAATIGRYSAAASSFFDGYLAEVNFIDGQALTPSSFGFYDNNGIWQPQGYTGTYGTNGFYLKFTDVGATSGANSGYGKDFSGFNTNYWTTNNFNSTSTSVSYDSMYDSPVNASNGITGIGNYAVLNPLFVSGSTLSNGNLTVTTPTTGGGAVQSTFAIPSSGQWYWEVTPSSSNTEIGIVSAQPSSTFLDSCSNAVSYNFNGQKSVDGSSSAYGASYTSGDVIGVACDAGAGTITFYRNNSSQGSISHTTSGLFASISDTSGSVTCSADFNFGQRPFAYTPPSGYSALNTQNLSTPTITNGAAYMAAVTYTGTGSSQTITASSTNSGNNPNGTTFQPDLVWVKGRSGATDHALYDAVRGVQLQLESNTTTAETTETTGLTAFTSSGFTTGALAQMNTNTATYVAWEWKAGGSNATNTSGSITSTVRANTSAGFSVVTFTGNGTNGSSVGHGLGVAPSMIILKKRSAAQDWYVGATAIGWDKYLSLNSTAAQTTGGQWFGNGTGVVPTSTVFYLGGAGNFVNDSGSTYVVYCFAPVAGYSAFGSYTGNGSTDGPFVYLGFRPRWIMAKRTDSTGDWWLIDTSRDTYNVSQNGLNPNLSNAESTGWYIDLLSNGFKIRVAGTGTSMNASGGTYIYACFAENPFKISRAR